MSLIKKEIELDVRYSETDQMQVVYHANYIVWFNIARDALLTELGISIKDGEKLGYLFPVIESHCYYKFPARYGDIVIIRAEANVSSIARLTTKYRVIRKRDKRLLAVGETVNVLTDRNGRLKIKIPAVWLEKK